MAAKKKKNTGPSIKEFIVMMASLMSIVAISIDATLPALGIIGADLNVSNINHTQYVISFLFMGLCVGQLFSGPLSDAIGRKKILFVGLGVYLVGALICFMSTSLEMLLVGRVIQGLGVSGPYVASVSIVRDKYSGRDMARIMSLVMVIFILVPAIAPALGQGIIHLFSWRAIFLMYVIYSIAVIIWLSFRLEETLPVKNRIKFNPKNLVHGFKEIIQNRTTVCYTLCAGICFGSLIGYLNSSRQIFQEMFGTGDMFALYFGCLALMIGVSSIVNSRIVQRLGMRYICKRVIICIVLSSAVFLLLNYLVEIRLWMFLAYAGTLFFCFGMIFGNVNAIAMEPMGHIAGIASALIGSTSSLISMTCGAIIGQLYDGTLIPLTCGFLALGVLSLVIMRIAEGDKFASE